MGNTCHCRREWHGRTKIILVTGEVDMYSCPVVQEAVAASLIKKPDAIILDLAGTDFLGSAGISVLIRAREQADDVGIGFGVVADTPATSRIIDLLGLGDVLNLHPDLDEALASLG